MTTTTSKQENIRAFSTDREATNTILYHKQNKMRIAYDKTTYSIRNRNPTITVQKATDHIQMLSFSSHVFNAGWILSERILYNKTKQTTKYKTDENCKNIKRNRILHPTSIICKYSSLYSKIGNNPITDE